MPSVAAAESVRSPPPTPWRLLARAVTGNPLSLLAGAMLVLFLGAALFGPALAPHDPLLTNASRTLAPPSADHWFGTDQLGRDIFSRVLAGTRVDFLIALGSVSLAATLGTTLGMCAGFLGGRTDRLVGRAMDMLMAFPLFVLAMAIVAALGNSVANIVCASALINLPFYVRLARTETGVLRQAGFIEAARLSGARTPRILRRHVLPNLLAPLSVQASLNMGWAMLNAAGLSFIGLGLRPPAPEWGLMVSEGAGYVVSGEWWVPLFPGIALMLSVLTFNLLGDTLPAVVDPRRR
ncbi:MAG: ABC transporter permease [Opitutaceae bacterium]|nr:ABC transporter permease [Opitutaceae bacterium]